MTGTLVKIGNRQLRLSNLEKLLYPDAGFTKGQVIEYYTRMAPIILPHIKNRPLTLKRYPNGVDAGFFYEKQCPSHKPDWIRTARVASENSSGVVNYCLVDSAASLVWIANLASIELHTLLARADELSRPTWMVFDLDPGPPAGILDCIPIALQLREILEQSGLQSFIKTSGGKGLHLWVPLNTPVSFKQTSDFAQAIARLMERQDPEHITANMRKSERPGKIFIDWSQNAEHKTTACAYSLRARAEPTVSTPVKWEEVEAASKRRKEQKLTFRAPEVLARVDKLGDLFAPVLKLKQKLPS